LLLQIEYPSNKPTLLFRPQRLLFDMRISTRQASESARQCSTRDRIYGGCDANQRKFGVSNVLADVLDGTVNVTNDELATAWLNMLG
jgi:hypothetical protein